MNSMHAGDREAEEADEPPFKRLTREEAQALRERLPSVSPWRVVAAQAAVGVLVAALVWAATQRGEVAVSALYGAAAAVLPSALLARGMTKRSSGAVQAAAGFLVWEMVKIGVAVAMLLLAPRIVQPLSWPALLAGLVVCIKVNWFALLWGAGAARQGRTGLQRQQL
jgi:ATP synthase protein I